MGEDQITASCDVSVKPGCDFWLQLENGYANHKSPPKHLLSPPQHQENPKIPEPGSRVHDYTCIYYKQINYCNSLIYWLPDNLTKKLQRVQNTAARLVFNLRKYNRIIPALVAVHWLPVKYRIEFKTLLIVFKGFHGKAHAYIQDMIIPSKSKRYSIRSNEERVLMVPKFKHDTFGKRAFAVYGSLAWNCLP